MVFIVCFVQPPHCKNHFPALRKVVPDIIRVVKKTPAICITLKREIKGGKKRKIKKAYKLFWKIQEFCVPGRVFNNKGSSPDLRVNNLN